MNIEEKNEKEYSLLEEILNSGDTNALISYISVPENRAWKYIDSISRNSLLHILIDKGHFEVLEKILKIIKDITNYQIFLEFIDHKNIKGFNAIHYACNKGNLRLVKILIGYGIEYKAKGSNGITCLHCAAQTNKISIIYFLTKKYNFDLYETDFSGNYFFHWACYSRCEEMIDFFLNDINFQINLKNKDGNIPLHFYLIKSNKRYLKKLIYRGADPYIKNNRGENAFDLVEKNYNNNNVKKEIKNILSRKVYLIWPFIFFLFYHFVLPFLIIIFFFPFIFLGKIKFFTAFYLVWNCLIFIYIFYFLRKSPGEIKPNEKNYLIRLLESNEGNNIDLRYYCIKCQIRKEINSRHCFFCDKCIIGFDHHCFWVNKCIGKDNKKSFYYLIILILINSLFNLVLCFLGQKNEKLKAIYFFNHFLVSHIKITKNVKSIILLICFTFTFFASIIIIPLIKVYNSEKAIDEVFENRIKLLINTNNENDEKEKLIIRNDDDNKIE